MKIEHASKVVLLAFTFAFGCRACDPPTPPPPDPDPYQNGPPRDCMDSMCNDGIACNGVEACRSATDACAPSAPRCGTGQTCSESGGGTCASCDTTPDQDMDLFADIACPGGTDCNDGDSAIFPGSMGEACGDDMAGRDLLRDEDCNPETFGAIDEDGDGVVADKCCNRRASDGALFCGGDCNDTPVSGATIHGAGDGVAAAVEVCNRIDDDCDRVIDEGIADTQTYYADCDGDGEGRSDWLGVALCTNATMPALPPTLCPAGSSALWQTSRNDCNDSNPEIRARACTAGARTVCAPGGDLCADLAAEHRSELSTYMQICSPVTCSFSDPCAPSDDVASRPGTAIVAEGSTSCESGNACNCTSDRARCMPADAGTAVAQTFLGLPPGDYQVLVSGDASADVRLILVATNTAISGILPGALSEVDAGLWGMLLAVHVDEESGDCPVIGIAVIRENPAVAVSINGITVSRVN